MTSLLNTPVEVLDKIYEWLRIIEGKDECGPRTWQFNSHALLPYTRAYCFHSPEITTPTQLHQFATTVIDTPELGQVVRRLCLNGSSYLARTSWPPDGTEHAVECMWKQLSQVRQVTIQGFDIALEGFIKAAKAGVILPRLERLEVGCLFEAWDNPYDPGNWQLLLQAAPNLTELWMSPAANGSTIHGLAPPACIAIEPFRTALATLRVTGFPAAHEAAIVNLINAFPLIRSMEWAVEIEEAAPSGLPLVRLPALRAIHYAWPPPDGDECEPVFNLDFCHLTTVEHVTLGAGLCAPSFKLHLPPSVRTLSLRMDNQIPLAALIALIDPTSSTHCPNLRCLQLDLPFAPDLEQEVEHMSITQIRATMHMCWEEQMNWTDVVTPDLLKKLWTVAERKRIKVTGTCRGVFRYQQAYSLQDEEDEVRRSVEVHS